MSGIEEYDEVTENTGPPVKTHVLLEIPGKPTLSELAILLGDNQEFVASVNNTRGGMW